MEEILSLSQIFELLSGSIASGLLLTFIPWALGMIFVSFKKIIL